MELSMDYKPTEKRLRNSREAYRCIMCGNPPREPKRSVIVEETINGKHYIFDSTRCALIFKKLVNVMGEGTTTLMV